MYFCSTPFREDALHSFRVIRKVTTSHQKRLPTKQLEIAFLNQGICWEIWKVMKSIFISTLLIKARCYKTALKGNGIKDIPPPHTPSCAHTVGWILGQRCSSFGSKVQNPKNLIVPVARNNSEPKEDHNMAESLLYHLIIIIRKH